MTVYSTSDLCDRMDGAVQVCTAQLQSFGGRRVAWGHIACVQAFEDAALIRQQLATPGSGRMLVVDGGGSRRVALLGDRMARLGMEDGWAGVLIYGAVRDTEVLASMQIAVFALGTVPLRGGSAGTGVCGGTLCFGGVSFAPGDFVCVDGDGLVVVPGVSARSMPLGECKVDA